MARLGKVSLGSGDQITLDFVGDGLMKVTVPSKQLGLIRDTKGRPLSSLIRNTGIIKGNGHGIVRPAARRQVLTTREKSSASRAKPQNAISGVGAPL